MSHPVRAFVVIISALLLGVIMAVGMLYMPDADEDIASYGLLLADLAVEQRNALNTLSGVLFDIRAFDTLGELLALFTASAGMHITLRKTSGERILDKPLLSRKNRPPVRVNETIKTICLAFVAPMAIYGFYICIRGHLTIGGGFQGGVIIASALFLLYLAGYFRIQEKIAHNDILDLVDVIAMGGFLLLGLAGLILAGSLFYNILPMGSTGDLFSSGIIPILSLLAGLEAAAALALIISHMQSQLLELEEKP